uniref:Ovochymase 2 (gene/pseudogene) n=1 Tax=Pelusios castaneus TaxID=367368 RepID=A0A8C8VQI5_9SAUR
KVISKQKILLALLIFFFLFQYPLDSRCGQKPHEMKPWNNFNLFTRIVGGNQVKRGSHPWQVSLKRWQRHFCGGTIVSAQWVVTAAHCVLDRNLPDYLNITAGEHDLGVIEEGEQTLPVKSIIKHPNFNPKRPMNYDIALVKLDGAFNFSSSVLPACLPDVGEKFNPGDVCTTCGWGRLSESGILPQVLHEVDLPIIDNKECSRALSTLRNPIRGDTLMCAGFPDGGKDACQGDSGGPLLCRRKHGAWTLAGVTSWGMGCARSWKDNLRKKYDQRGSPGVFTDLRKVLSWIRENINTGNKTSSCSIQDGKLPSNEGELYFPETLTLRGCKDSSCISDVLWRFCGVVSPLPILVGSNSIKLKFVSDNKDHGTGFSMMYRAFAPGALPDSGCGSLAVLFEGGVIQSMNYPEPYSNLADCHWIIHAPENHVIKVQCRKRVHFSYCADNFCEKEITKSCGFAIPAPVLSTSSMMLIIFHSDETETFGGFRATFSFIHEAGKRMEAYCIHGSLLFGGACGALQ